MTRTTETPFSIRRALVAGAAALTVQLSAASVLAQMVCGNHADIEKRLETGYQETRTAIGLAANGGLIEIYTSEKGTFTVVLTRPNGLSCLMAVGDGWETVKPSTPARWASSPLTSPHGGLPSM